MARPCLAYQTPAQGVLQCDPPLVCGGTDDYAARSAVRACDITPTGRLNKIVITGLDPVIHLLRKTLLRRWMDARIKSGHDRRVLWSKEKKGALRTQHTPLQFFRRPSNSRYTFATSRHNAPELYIYLPPPKRAWGMPGARCTRGLVCTLVVVKRTRVTTSTPESPGIPARNGFNGFLRALPGDRAVLPPSSADMFCLSPVGPT